MDWLKMLAIAGMNGGGSGGGVSPEEVTTIVKEQFPGGVGYEEAVEVEIFKSDTPLDYYYQTGVATLQAFYDIRVGQRFIGIFDGVRYEGVAAKGVELTGIAYDPEAVIVLFSDDTYIALTSAPETNQLYLRHHTNTTPTTVILSVIEERASIIYPKFLPEHLRFGGTPEKRFKWGGAYTDTGDNFIHSITATYPDTGETMEVPLAFAKLTDEIVSRKQLVGDSTTSGAMWANGTTYPVVIEDSFVYSSGTYQMVMTPYGNGPLLFSGPKGVAVFSVTLDGMEMPLSCTFPSDGTYVSAIDGEEVYALKTVEDITPISAKYMPKVADLSGTWIAELKAALGI